MKVEVDSENVTIVKENIIKRLRQENLIHNYCIYQSKQMRLFNINGIEYLEYDNLSTLHDNDMFFFSSLCKYLWRYNSLTV